MLNSAEIEFEEISIALPWGQLAGRWYGNRKVRPVLALHGWMDNLGTWSRLIPLLPKHVGILAIDFPGHGRSSKYPPGIIYHYMDYVAIVARIMQEYKWQKISLLGHSMGGVVALFFAALYPNKVDMLISIDIIIYGLKTAKEQIELLVKHYEGTMLEDERLAKVPYEEPTSRTVEALEQLIHKSSGKSIDLDNCKFILERYIEKSKKYPDKYYFSRDNKTKFLIKFFPNQGLFLEMAKKLRDTPHIIIKGSRSQHIKKHEFEDILKFLKKHNSHFEFHEIDGTHHIHLNNAEKVAALTNPFINRFRPAALDRWSITDEIFTEKAQVVDKTSKNSHFKTEITPLQSKL